ncbi:hypothetical protein HDU91_000602, partial [Kappamyces sp. JEL0680]
MLRNSCHVAASANTVLNACRQQSSGFDVMVIDATQVGLFQDCLLDLYAWDFSFGVGMDDAALSNGVYNDRLVALPYEAFKKVLLYNSVYLSSHGYDKVPTDLAQFYSMLDDIQVNERGAENYLLTGFSAPYSEPEEFISLVAEWAAGVGSAILKDRSVSLVTGNFTKVMNHLLSWLDQSLLDTSAFSDEWDTLFQSFIDRHDVFVHADATVLLEMDRVPFEWGVAPMPGLSVSYVDDDGKEQTIDGIPAGTLAGSYIGVNRHSSNLAGA